MSDKDFESKFTDEVDNSLLEIDEEIEKMSKLRGLVAKVKLLDLTEDEYHDLCETPMRYTDALGEMLGTKLGFSFKRRTSSSFCYEMMNGWELCIPSSHVHGVEIVVPRYYKENAEEDSEVYLKKDNLNEIRENIGHIERGFFNSGYIGKAMCVFFRKYTHNFLGKTAMVIEYTLSNPKKHYKKRYEEIYTDLKVRDSDLQEKIIQTTVSLHNKRKEQEAMLETYSKQLFKWTETIRVREEGSSTVLETITRQT